MAFLQDGKRLARLIFGLFLYAVGMYFRVQANVGMAPWDVFHQGLALQTGITLGNAVVVTSLAIVLLDICLREQIGVGSILNSILIGVFYDWIDGFGLLPKMDNAWSGVAMMLMGMIVVALASYFYIGAEYGCGPRDSLMVAICRRWKGGTVGKATWALEGTALVIGWLFGGSVGVGTLVSVLAVGVVMQTAFRILHFDVTALHHENLFESCRRWSHVLTKH